MFRGRGKKDDADQLGARMDKVKISGGDGEEQIRYTSGKVIGNGSFGVVFQATVAGTKEVVAIKKVLQDKRFKNRELQIMRTLSHCNVVAMRHCFYSAGDKPDEVYLNLVMEFVPDTIYHVCHQHRKAGRTVPMLSVKLYTYQLLRALNYIHGKGICHRDIKPQNLLVNATEGVLKLCDFGSAKILVPGEPNVSYICSRYYRAPELIFGATQYAPSIDVWSTACVMAELLLGQPLFPGESGVDQLVEVIKILGTPTRQQIFAMNPNYTDFKFPSIKPHKWEKVFGSHVTPDAIDLLSKLLTYEPGKRLKPLEACLHPFFDELRDPATSLPHSKPLPPLFDFSKDELRGNEKLAPRLIPDHARKAMSPNELAELGLG